MRIFPGTRITVLDSTTVRVEGGTTPPIMLSELLPAEIDWLLSAFEKPGEPTTHIGTGRRTRLSAEAQRELEKILVAKGFASSKLRRLTPDSSPASTAEVLAQQGVLGSIRTGDATDLNMQRENAIVAIKHISRTTLEAIRVLVSSGVLKFIVDDPRPNVAVDLLAVAGFPATPPTFEEAASAYIRSLHKRAQTLSSLCRPTLTILGADHEPAYLDSALLTSHGAPHLIVTVDSRKTAIGPLILPQHDTSLCCYQHQLSPAPTGEPPRIQSRTAGIPAVQSSVNASLTGSLVAHHVLQYIDGFLPISAQTLTHTGHHTNTPDYESLVLDPTCFCAHARSAAELVANTSSSD